MSATSSTRHPGPLGADGVLRHRHPRQRCLPEPTRTVRHDPGRRRPVHLLPGHRSRVDAALEPVPRSAPWPSSTGRRAGHEQIRSWCTDRLERWAVPHERRTSLRRRWGRPAGHGGGRTGHRALPAGDQLQRREQPDVAGTLAARLRVVVADLPGPARAVGRRRPQGPARLRRVGREVVRPSAADRLVLAGHSLGAAAALTADPAGVQGLLLLDPAGLIRLRVRPGTLAATLPWLLRPTPDRSARLLARCTPGAVRPRRSTSSG